MRAFGRRHGAVLALVGLIGLAVFGWVGAQQIRSPAQVAVDTAPPPASPITVPVVRQKLASNVIVRGTVRYGAPQSVVLATSTIKTGSDIVTRAPRRRTKLTGGRVALTVDGRPVFVLPGSVPMHRDLGPGDSGPDVRQLEQALAGDGLSPGVLDGVFDGATERAVGRFYQRRGWDPFGPTEQQRDLLRTAEAAAATARDAHLQAVNNVEQARRAVAPAEIAQAGIDAVAARKELAAAVMAVGAAEAKLASTRALARGGASSEAVAVANAKSERAKADAEVAAKRAALNQAVDEERIARTRYQEIPADAPPSEREAAAAAVRQGADKVRQAQAELQAAIAAAEAARAATPTARQRARQEAAQARSDARAAAAELEHARATVRHAREQVRLAERRARLLAEPPDVRTLQAITASAARERRRTEAEVARLSRQAGVQVPANEILFFPSLPLRVDAVKANRGATVTGPVMTVTNSRLAIDSHLSASDVKLVRPNDAVTIEEQDLGIKIQGRVSRVADTPGTNGVDPTRYYFEVVPTRGFLSLVGASVKLTVAVKSTRSDVLAVPVSALSVGGDGNSRIQVRRGSAIRVVPVAPGLAAEGLVEVRPLGGARLAPGDLVVVGTNGSSPPSAGKRDPMAGLATTGGP